MTITAAHVKELRDRTGAGMMDAKNALTETKGDMEAAIDWLRTKGIAKAAKKAGRVASEGIVWAYATHNKGALVEVNSETDFAAKNENFREFAKDLCAKVHDASVAETAAVLGLPWGEATVQEKLTNLVATIGENMSVRRATVLEVKQGVVASYIHMHGKIGVLVAIETSKPEPMADVARQVAMHVAAANPAALDRSSADPAQVERERQIYMEKAKASGKPAQVIEKIVEGQINKYFEETCLVDQAFIIDTDRKVADVVKAVDASAKITAFVRYALGEGIEKAADDFAAEVAKVVNG